MRLCSRIRINTDRTAATPPGSRHHAAANVCQSSRLSNLHMKNLEARAWLGLAVLALVMAILLFVPAGTVHYWQAWVYLAIFFGMAAFTTRDLIRRDPAL